MSQFEICPCVDKPVASLGAGLSSGHGLDRFREEKPPLCSSAPSREQWQSPAAILANETEIDYAADELKRQIDITVRRMKMALQKPPGKLFSDA